MTDDAQRRARQIVETMLPDNPEKWDEVEDRGHASWLNINRMVIPPSDDYLSHDEADCPLCERIRKKVQ